MKIALIDLLFQWPPDGGARVDVFHLLKYLATSSDVQLFFPRVANDPFGRGKIEDGTDTSDEHLSPVDVSIEAYQDLSVLDRLLERVNAYSPDKVIITDGWHLKPYLITKFAAYKPIVRMFAHEMLCIKGHGHRYHNEAPCDITYFDDGFDTCQECFGNWYENTNSNAFNLEIEASGLPVNSNYPEIVREALGYASAVIVYNHHEKNRLAPYCKNVVVCPGGVEQELFTHPIMKTNTPKGKTWRFLVVGRCDDYLKGLHVVRAAVQHLQSDGTNDFEVVYTGTQGGTRSCSPLGWLAREKVIEEIQKADITIHPSVWPEPFGIAAVESLALGTPIIASDHGGLKGIVQNTAGGWLFPAGDAKRLSDLMHTIMNSPKDVRTLAGTVRTRTYEYSWQHVFQNCYDPLLETL